MGALDYNGLSAIFYRYYRRLAAYAQRYVSTRDEAEDIVQECFVKLWQMRGIYSDVPTGALLFTMVRNACLDSLKHAMVVSRFETVYAQQQDSLDSESVWDMDFFGDAAPDDLRSDLYNKVMREVERLPEKCREAFRMSRLEGLTNHEIAEVMGISDAAVHKHIDRAVRKLSRALGLNPEERNR